MFDTILITLSNQLNAYLRNKLGSEYETPVLITKLVNEDGSSTLGNVNSVIISLVNIQQENMVSRTAGPNPGLRPVSLNLYVLFSACFTENYLNSFKYLSGVISFFQANPVMSHSSVPELDDAIIKLTFEIENLDTAAVSQLWGALGAKLMPSILYKIRMVTVNEASGAGFSVLSGMNN
jgi:hypothetical protein